MTGIIFLAMVDYTIKARIEEVFGNRIKRFQKLMRFKIRDILLVSSLYDNYLFEEDGRLYEQIREEYQSLNLSHAPELTHVTTAEEACELLKNDPKRFDLIISTVHIEDMSPIKFAEELVNAGIDTPRILLAYDNKERKDIETNYDTSVFDKIFIWQGDYRLLIGIIKYIEDKLNVEDDTRNVGVQSIILLEDNVKFYSSYLPLIYTEIFNQSQRLISGGVNMTHRFLRMRARPKILLCTTYEEAWDYYTKYKEFLLGIISDITFKVDGVLDQEAGLKFARQVRKEIHDIPILLQSSKDHRIQAYEVGASYLHKKSPRLLHDLRRFMLSNFGFGDFIFRTPDGKVVGNAVNLKTLQEQLARVPEESIIFHAERNHFSNWLKARTEFWLASRLRPGRVSDFANVEELRQDLINEVKNYREMRLRGIITEFRKDYFDPYNSFARIGSGSLGGKARGLGFVNTLINNFSVREKFDDVEVFVPSAVVIATDVFDQFMEENDLFSYALAEEDDKRLIKRFREASNFPQEVKEKLREFLALIKEPLAVRSSSLLEDSQFQPFAGVYDTFMIPNENKDPEVRLEELLVCIKRVYASTFLKNAKDYLKATSYRLEEEKMAVIVQKLVGAKRGERYYPDFAGVAKSHNFYPVPPQKPGDGIALVALGLGRYVVEGGNTVRFCPQYPKHLLQFFSTKNTIQNAQQNFFALDAGHEHNVNDEKFPESCVQKYALRVAEKDQTLFYVGSTYSAENDMVYDGISRPGSRVVTFAPILKHKMFPLPEILGLLLKLGRWGMGTHVEIEFAVNTKVPQGKPKEFALLQMRPMVLSRESEDFEVNDEDRENLVCLSGQVLGDGIINDVYDVVFVDIDKYDRAKSKLAAKEVSEINEKMIDEKKQYILIGVGRWGSLDHWLGIPVTWDQISGAAVIVESGFKDFSVEPSQGSHFFQNITSFRIGYFTIKHGSEEEFIDWQWLREQEVIEQKEFATHIRMDKPFNIKINGKRNKGIIIKPSDPSLES